jgi:DNA primase
MNNTSFTQTILDHPLATVADYYAHHLNDAAHTFLSKNCLSADDSLRVGFSDRTLGKQIPDKQFKAGREVRTKLKQLGILKRSGHEALRGFVTVPLTNADGKTTGIHGLRVDNHGKEQPQLTIGSGIFNAAALTSFDEVVVCANVLDAWTFHAAGHANVIAWEGEQLNKGHIANVKRVLLVDPSLDESLFDGIELMRVHFPERMTVNQYAILNRTIDDALGKRIRAASGVSFQLAKEPEQQPTAKEANDAKEKPATPTASPTPAPIDGIEVERSETEVTLRIEERRWRVRGLERNNTSGVMKINLLIFNERNERFHVDTLDLYHSRSRRVYLKESAEETALSENELRSDLGRVLLKLEELQEEQRTQGKTEAKPVELTDAERSEAMELLKSENLLDRILDDFEACGIVGERTGKLAGYLAATSRLLDKPLGLVIQSSSAAGKSALADAVLRFMPPEQRFACSAMTSQSLYYLGNENLKHKILSVAEEEGVRDASYQLKLLQSEGHLSLVATSKESGTGRTVTERYEVEGPVALVMTTTALDVDPELMNRCLVVNVDESAEQTQAIHDRQRHAHTLEGIRQAGERGRIETLHQNSQRLLRSLVVVNPYADQLKFIGNQARHRRDHIKYLTLINAVTFLHQYQREIKRAEINGVETEYIEVTRRDIVLANMIADWALGRSIDELAGPTRRLLIGLYDWLRGEAKKHKLEVSEITFTRRQAREALGWSATPMRVHLERLCQHEYVVPHGGGRGKLCKYSLLYNGRGREGQPSMVGLIDPAKLTEPNPTTTTTPTSLTGQKAT